MWKALGWNHPMLMMTRGTLTFTCERSDPSANRLRTVDHMKIIIAIINK